MSRDSTIDALLAACAAANVGEHAYNQYADDGTPGNQVRRENLTLHLQQALALRPAMILIGEAPGYLGCRRTGVPFTSEPLLLAGVDPPGLFGAARGFRLAGDSVRTGGEQTATIVWRELGRHGLVALGWNAWPFHPHRPGNPTSNRPPRVSELAQGRHFLRAFLDLAPGVPLVAMGNSAASSLTTLGLPHSKLRHPAQGGARLFADGLGALIERGVVQ